MFFYFLSYCFGNFVIVRKSLRYKYLGAGGPKNLGSCQVKNNKKGGE